MGIQPLDSPTLSRTRQTSGNTCESRCRPEDDIPVSRFISRMPRDIDIGASGIPYSASGVDTSGIAPAWPFPQLLLASLWTS
ncbi:hypothetical protein Mukteswar_004771 [Burkholderia mallei]|uniref:hypothetical protein n=1 Tax=Burkholderia mallei TaxID=13373 RepID=UPI00203CB96F|nr:hypothetical protein [Burkholderia mallei]WPJ31001.1 hypothetical protein Zagreb_001602 [Burkholderia mallei]WPJ37088.1 hypothetical protein Mukteswar_004771 [Burkholderia mallei]WPJ41205.1 hypothetical protein Bogor_000774 [Burkholderia mallei]